MSRPLNEQFAPLLLDKTAWPITEIEANNSFTPATKGH